MSLTGNILITGGTGTLGKALLTRAQREDWPCRITVYSRDEMKQQALKAQFPRAHWAIGDVADYDTLERVMVGHELVIHAAAFKHIPAGETNVEAMLLSNLIGAQNVARAAVRVGARRVVGLSTDKACHPVNAYGASKMLMERIFQEWNTAATQFTLTRYGNVLSSTGSVVPVWRAMLERDGKVTATDPDMTRFWLTATMAVTLVEEAAHEPGGTILIPKLPGLSMSQFASYVLPQAKFEYTGLRPGEKRHEELLTREEAPFAEDCGSYFRLWPVWGAARYERELGYVSNRPERILERDELLEMLR